MTAAEKKAFSKDMFMAGYSKAQTAAVLGISNALIDDYWEEWQKAWIFLSDEVFVSNAGVELSDEHGAGAIGTAFAPKTFRWIRDSTIITEIQVDLTGLACKGDAQGDVIGLAAGGAAYIGRYVAAKCGLVHRIEMLCVEAPGEGTATIEADIDLMADDEADLAYDDAADDTVIAAGLDWVPGKMVVDNIPALTDNDYLYLGEGDTGGSTGEYNAGQLIIKMYGHLPLIA